jgi:ATP-binding cassette subfamily B protein RaxB
VREIYLLRSHVDRVEELLREEIEVPSPDSALRQRLAGSIDCRRLVFRYPGGTLVLDNFNCAIEAGESVVICGPSGAGKSTLLRLLSGGLRPDRGSLRFDNVEAALWDVDALREQFGVVLQFDRLFQGTIADNVSCFDLTPDVGRIRDAASLAAIWEDLQALPMNIQMPIGDGGAGLSGGQVQRILLARALYRQPRILFLDEATSHLDKDTETRVLDNLRALGITMVSVAHGENALALGGRQIQIKRLVV